jgi:hypothetical protein
MGEFEPQINESKLEIGESEPRVETSGFIPKPQSGEIEPKSSEFSEAFAIGYGYIGETIEQDVEQCDRLFGALGINEAEGRCILEHIRSYYLTEEDKRSPEDGAVVKMLQNIAELEAGLREANSRAEV